MGCEFNFAVLDGATTEAEAIEQVKDIIDTCLYEHGHGGYTGSFAECTGVTVSKETFTDFDAAERWLDEHAEKWGDAIIVKTDQGYCVGANCSS